MRNRTLVAVLGLCVALAVAWSSPAAERAPRASAPGPTAAAAGVRLLRVGNFDSPTYLTAPRGDRRRFVTERAGRIRIVRGGRKLRRPFLDIRGLVSTAGEGGLLSMAFAPDYRRSRLYYVFYVDRAGAVGVDRFRASARNPNRTQPGSRRRVIRQAHPETNHKGGQVQFGRDGRLYVSFGDGGGGGDPYENAQDLSSRLGKILRIAPRPGGGYRIPRDNPFVGRRGARGEIFAYGLRNPYRFSFDRRTGSLSIGDVGEGAVEEVDFLPVARGKRRPRGGANFGWDVFEGRRRFEPGSAPRHVPPVLQRTRSTGVCSIIGGYVIRDRSLGSLYGRYVYGDLCDSRLRVARLRRPRARGDRALRARVGNLVSFGEDGRGRVHAVSLDGGVFRLARR